MAQNSFFLLRIASVSLILHKNMYCVIKCILCNVLVFLGHSCTILTFLGHSSGHEYENFSKSFKSNKRQIAKTNQVYFPSRITPQFSFYVLKYAYYELFTLTPINNNFLTM